MTKKTGGTCVIGCSATMTTILIALLLALAGPPNPTPEYSIQAIRYATVPNVEVTDLVIGAPKDEKVDIAMVFWLIRGGGKNILFDSGFHREEWFKYFPMTDYMRPDEAVKLAGVKPEEITDIVVSHAHWDHMGGIDLFPKATCGSRRKNSATTRETRGNRVASMMESMRRTWPRWCD
jgi:glyoxylase-like metal-dependent hydrolase (beta-lactamase superfamily II)